MYTFNRYASFLHYFLHNINVVILELKTKTWPMLSYSYKPFSNITGTLHSQESLRRREKSILSILKLSLRMWENLNRPDSMEGQILLILKQQFTLIWRCNKLSKYQKPLEFVILWRDLCWIGICVCVISNVILSVFYYKWDIRVIYITL